jgi:hypothetical protein
LLIRSDASRIIEKALQKFGGPGGVFGANQQVDRVHAG